MGRLCAWAFVVLATAHEAVWATRGFGNGVYGIEKRQTPSPNPPGLSFDQIDDMQTCEPATIQWAYSGPPINMTLAITNVDVEQSDVSFTPIVQTVTMSTKVNPASLSFTWESCNVTSGTYQLVASIASQRFLQKSPSFLVLSGDASCLTVPISTGTAAIPYFTYGLSDPTPSASLNTAAIAGIVVGCVAAVAITILAAFFFIRRQPKRQAVTRRQEFSRGWNGVNSTNSSVRTVVGTATDKIGGSRSEEKLGSTSRKNSLASYDSHAMTLATLPSLHHQQPSAQEYDGNNSSFSHTTADRYVPAAPSIPLSGEEKKANRASLGRKRKPAPVYDETDIPPFPSSLSSQSHTPLAPSSNPPSTVGDPSQPQTPTIGHYTTRTGTNTRPSTGDASSELLHKSSFGVEGKPMHYLMPDLPAGASQR